MGQRTAIIAQHRNAKGETKTRVFYCQWGIGRILPSQLMTLLTATLSVSMCDRNFIEKIQPQGTTDITKYYNEEELNALDFDDPESVGLAIREADNNNGGIFVRITTNEMYDDETIKYRYMLGEEEGGTYDKFCTDEEWMARFDGYIDSKFLKAYKNITTYFTKDNGKG